MLRSIIALLAVTTTTLVAGTPASLTVQADKTGSRISPLLWGIFFEDINLSADGGIYPELIRNRSFEDAETAEYWTLTNYGDGRSEMSLDKSRPLNPFNRQSLRVKLQGIASLNNEGYWGMNLVRGQRYTVRLAARAADGFTGPLTVMLYAKDQNPAVSKITGISDRWQYFTVELPAPGNDPKGRFSISMEGKGTVWLDMVSVMPNNTWKNHGLRPDLCEKLDDLKPSFLRFPGGCWVEGHDMSRMYQWKKTIGKIEHRQPLYNIWQYHATHGLGYHEYLQLSEDLGAEPLYCINVGMSHTENVPLDQMGQWVQDALDAIEYANGPTNTVWGGLRAQNGHPAPFNMKYIEIGNENGGPAYHERWELFYKAIKAKYPEMQLIANVWGGYPTRIMPEIIDEHYYNNPEFFMREAHKYDRYDRKGPKVFVGEYAVTSGSGLGNLRGAIGEAAFMTGIERNSDIVTMACYAPLFVNVNHKRWPINLINFDSSSAFGIPSYYVQQMFSVHRGDYVLPVTLQSPETETHSKGGTVGVGTWLTQAEYKDIKVTRNGETLFAADLREDTKGWKLLGGDWRVEEGALRQNSRAENVRAIIPGQKWTDYTLSLKARKLGGAEGFLILFNVGDENAKSWWNLGGWGNRRHGVEIGGGTLKEVDGTIETGRWYDIRVEVQGAHIKCFLDGKLIHEVDQPRITSLYASASREQKSGDLILKVVNVAAEPITTTVEIQGLGKLASSGKAIVLTSGSPLDENTLEQPKKVAPKEQTITVSGPKFDHAFPGNSLTVLRLKPE